jgi:hypothetical protein
MESALEIAADCQPDASTKLAPKKRRRGYYKRSRPQLLLRSELDGRTGAAKYFDRLVTAIETDLAGADQLSAIEKVLVEAYAGAAVSLQHMNAKLALGEEIDISEHSSCVGALVRVASRLGLRRRQKDVTPPSLDEYLASKDSADTEEIVG